MFSRGIDKQHRILVDYIFEYRCRFLCRDFQVAHLCHNFYVNHENVKANQHLFNKAVVKIKQKKCKKIEFNKNKDYLTCWAFSHIFSFTVIKLKWSRLFNTFIHRLYFSSTMPGGEFVSHSSNIKTLCWKIFNKASKTKSTVSWL